MNKIFKLGAITLLAGFITISSGCSCKASDKKVKEDAVAIYNDNVFDFADGQKDFTLTFNDKKESEEENVAIVVKSDAETSRMEIGVTGKSEYTIKIYKENGKYKYKMIMEGKEFPADTGYTTLAALLKENELLQFIEEFYVKYKNVPYNTYVVDLKGEETPDIPQILKARPELEETARKKLFKKVFEYEFQYRVSISEFHTLNITSEKGKVTYIKVESSKAAGKNANIETYNEFKISYDDVELN